MRAAETGSARTVRGSFVPTRDWALEHPVVFVFVVALLVRLLVAIAITVTVGIEDANLDSHGYDLLASDWASGRYHDWSPQQDWYFNHNGGYVLPLGVLYRIFGDHLVLGQLLAVALGALSAAIATRLLLEVAPARWSLFGGLIVALFPSVALFSSTALKDAAVWTATGSITLLVVWAVRARGWRLVVYGLAIAALLFWLGHLRLPTLIVAAWALVVAALFSLPAGRLARVAGAIVILAAVPWYLGLGPGAIEYGKSHSPRETRVRTAEGADTAVIGDTSTDDDFSGEIAYLPKGLTVILLEPTPWTSLRGYEVRLAQAELLLWYPLLIVAAVGIPALFRKRRELAFLATVTVGLVIVYALYEGNFGTALRHRGELVPPLAVLAALGAPALLDWRPRRRTEVTSPAPAR